MRIVHHIPRIDRSLGGVVTAVLDLCRALSSRGLEITILTSDPRDAPEEWRAPAPGRPALRLLGKSGPGGLLPSRALHHAREEIESADVLHLHGMWSVGDAQLARLARRAGTPYVVSPHGMLDDWPMSQKRLKKRVFHALLGARLLRGATAVHCTAEEELRQSARWFPKRLGRVIPLILDLEPYRSPPGPERARERFPALLSGRPSLLFLSRIHPKKGLEHLIEAAAILQRQGSACDVLVAGTGDEPYVESLKALARERGVSERVSFLGMVVGDDKVSLFQAADVFVLPTSQENFGFVLIESLAAGTPVVTTKGVDIWRELEGSGGAVIIGRASGEAVAEAAKSALEAATPTPASADRPTGAAGRDWVFQALHPEALAGRFEELYAGCSIAPAATYVRRKADNDNTVS